MDTDAFSFSQRLRQMQNSADDVPAPEGAAKATSEALCRRIRDEIRSRDGELPFWRYMETALYEPGLGYYSAGSRKLGREGDFITAPEISPLFSRTIAAAIMPVLEHLEDGAILEVGAGSGVMAAEMLAFLAAHERLPERYEILEVSADLRERQRQSISERAPELVSKVTWRNQLPATFRGVIVANELLDAMPVHRFCIEESEVRELFVAEGEAGFCWRTGEPSTPRLQSRAKEIEQMLGGALPEGYVSEVLFAAEDWVKSIANRLESGLLLLMDYGYPRRAYYHPQRHHGTLQCHYRHRVHDDPFFYPGLQDITAHVDFTAIADAALEAGLGVAGYATQAHFLLGSGIIELLEQTDDEVQQLAQMNAIKKLTLPQEMGESFKIMGLSKNLDLRLAGFQMNDMRDRL